MAETYPTDAELAALSGTNDAAQEVLYIPTGQSPYHLSFYKMLFRLLDTARRAGDLRVFKDGDLTFGVRAGSFMAGLTSVAYAGAAAQALVDDATNYIYLTAAGVLTVNQAAFPDPAVTPHLPLATITTADGAYDFADIADCRGRAMFRSAGVIAAAGLGVTAGTVAASKAVVVNANKDIAGFRFIAPDVQANLAATGSTKDDAAAITAQIVYITSDSGAKGVILPAAARMVFIRKDPAGGAGFNLYPNAGGTLNGGAANAPKAMGVGSSCVLVQIAPNVWWTIAYSTAL